MVSPPRAWEPLFPSLSLAPNSAGVCWQASGVMSSLKSLIPLIWRGSCACLLSTNERAAPQKTQFNARKIMLPQCLTTNSVGRMACPSIFILRPNMSLQCSVAASISLPMTRFGTSGADFDPCVLCRVPQKQVIHR